VVIDKCLHYALRIPENGIGMEICCWVKPKIELLLSIAFALTEHIGVKDVRLTTHVPQEFKVNLIPVRPFWWQLHYITQNQIRLEINRTNMEKLMHKHKASTFCWMLTYIIGSDSACRVSKYKLELHINVAKEVFIFGLKAWSRGSVKGKSEKVVVTGHTPRRFWTPNRRRCSLHHVGFGTKPTLCFF